LNRATGLANVIVLSNIPGYTILAPYAAGNFQGVTPSFGTWATTDHMVGSALGFPLARWLACDTIWSFVPMRFLLGLAGGVILPVGQAVLLGEYPPEQRTLGVGIWGVLSMMPFTIGVFTGGWYAEYFGWRTLFYSNVVIALTVAAVVGSLVYGRGIKRHISRLSDQIAPRSMGAFTSKLSTGRSPFPLLDMTTTASLDSFCRRDLYPQE
jgi:DHA2 family multidrug resistance protein